MPSEPSSGLLNPRQVEKMLLTTVNVVDGFETFPKNEQYDRNAYRSNDWVVVIPTVGVRIDLIDKMCAMGWSKNVDEMMDKK